MAYRRGIIASAGSRTDLGRAKAALLLTALAGAFAAVGWYTGHTGTLYSGLALAGLFGLIALQDL